MLTTILNNLPPPKCIIIQDSLAVQGKHILYSIIKNHLATKIADVHLFIFENNVKRIKKVFNKAIVHDFTDDIEGWIDEKKCKNVLNTQGISGVIIFDSLIHVILKYGVSYTYKLLNKLMNQTELQILQIATILHADTTNAKTLQYFSHISTLHIILIENKTPRLKYTHKKPGGKIIKNVEEFSFNNDILCTQPIQVDTKTLLTNVSSNTLPENMTTFKISLEENERISREKLSLPYVKTNELTSGSIIYNMDEDDDWDEEDPDDDLDI